MIGRRIVLMILWCVSVAFTQEKIRGKYSYTFGDKESLVEARQTCKDLAIREAIESYYVFVESSTEVENFQLKEDIIESISAGYLKHITVVEQKEEGRTITTTVEAEVMPDEVKAVVEKLVQNQRQKEEDEEKNQPVVADTSPADESTGGKSISFLTVLSLYERREQSVEDSWRQKKFDSALTQNQTLQRILERYKPNREDLFQWLVYECFRTRTVLQEYLLRVESCEAQRMRVRAIVGMKLVYQKMDELKGYVDRLQKLTRLTDAQKKVRRSCIARSRHILDLAQKKAVSYRRR